MKITKSTLAQIIKEEMAALNEALPPDIERINKALVLHKISDLITNNVNTLPEFYLLLDLIVGLTDKVKPALKVTAIRNILKAASEAPEPAADTQTDTALDTPPPVTERRRIKRRRK